MPKASELLEQAAKSRDAAKRAHRLAGTVNKADRYRLTSYGDELLAQASSLENQAAAVSSASEGVGRPVVQRQKEQQHQQAKTDDPKK